MHCTHNSWLLIEEATLSMHVYLSSD